VPLLTQALDREPASLEHIRALGRIRSNAPQAVPALLRVLMGKADSTSSQHRVAEEALLALGSEAVPYVIDELRDAQQKSRRSKLQISWFRILESCGPDAAPAIPLLIAELGREYYWYRELAAKALGAIGPPAREAVPHLERILEDPKEFTSVLDAAWRALRRIRPAH
jgi:HEAT repeat protein